MACDICGKTGTRLVDLRECYQTDDIQQICPECETIVNRQHSKLLSFVLKIKEDLFKRFLRERKNQGGKAHG